ISPQRPRGSSDRYLWQSGPLDPGLRSALPCPSRNEVPMTAEHGQRTQVEQIVAGADDAAHPSLEPIQGNAGGDNIEAGGVRRECGQDDPVRCGQEARRTISGNAYDRMQVARDGSISEQRSMTVADRPAADRASRGQGE